MKRDGTVACWGKNGAGQCSPPDGLAGVVSVAAGASHTAAVLRDGTVRCWGGNASGQCSVPEGCTNAVAAAAGLFHAAALTTDGRVVCWGDNAHGQTNTPSGMGAVTAVGAGQYHTLARTSAGEIVCWGDNAYGQSETNLPGAPACCLGGGVSYSLALAGHRPLFTDPLDADTDGDGMPDGWEAGHGGFDPLAVQTDGTHGAGDDPDGDGLDNAGESGCGTDPSDGDTDDDGLTDNAEFSQYGTDPVVADTDGDGLADGPEVDLRATYPDLNPLLWDSDGDMLPDGWEVQYGLSPCECVLTNSPGWDADGDGLGLFDEYRYCTSPATNDTDGDCVSDGDEIPHSPGSCPNDASDNGDPANCVTLRLTVGDPSGSHSERWNMDVSEYPSGRAVIRHCDGGFGTPGSAEYALVKGKSYTFRLRWIATDPWYTGTPKPDYDWQCLINSSAVDGARSGLYGTGPFIVEDPGEILTGLTQGNETDITRGREGRIIVPKLVTETVATSPPDRTRKTIGVGEEVLLKLLPDSLENVTWTKTSGDGNIDFGESAVFTAPDNEGFTILAANCQGASLPVTFSVIEPDGVVFENNDLVTAFAPPSQNFYSIKYFANVYFMPDAVNFGKIKVSEGYAQTQTEPGYFRDYPPDPHPSWENMPRDVGGSAVVEGKGTKANWANGDEITGGSEYVSMVPIRDGYAWWDIPWKYKVGDGAYKQICTARQDYRLTGNSTNATFRITKEASGAEISTGEVEAHFVNP